MSLGVRKPGEKKKTAQLLNMMKYCKQPKEFKIEQDWTVHTRANVFEEDKGIIPTVFENEGCIQLWAKVIMTRFDA